MSNSVLPSSPSDQSNQVASSTLAKSIAISIKEQAIVWLVGFIIGILSLFSSKVTESIRFAINSADLGSKNYEQLAMDLSDFIFHAELIEEFIKHDWTTEKSLKPLVMEYNSSVSQLRKREYVYLAWSDRYWGKDRTETLQEIMASVKQFDTQIHTLNDEFQKVFFLDDSGKKVDPTLGKQAIELAHPFLDKVRTRTEKLLIDLAGSLKPSTILSYFL